MTQDARFVEWARAVSDQQLLVAPVEPAVKLDLVNGTIAGELVDVSMIAAPAPLESEGRNLFGEAGSPPGRAGEHATAVLPRSRAARVLPRSLLTTTSGWSRGPKGVRAAIALCER